MKIDIIGGSQQARYNELNSQRTINYWVKTTTQQEKDKSESALYPFPGLTLLNTLPGRYFRGALVARTTSFTRCFVVMDTTLYELFTNGSYSSRGSLYNIGTGSSLVNLVCGASQEIGIFHYNASYVFNMNTNTLVQQSSSQFPGFADGADYDDGYTFISSQGSVFYSNNNSMLIWTGTNTFTPTFTSAPTKAIATLNQQLYAFTSETIEPYYNDQVTPFSRRPFSTTYIGITAPKSLVKLNEGFIFLGQTRSGETAVYMYNIFTYTCNMISDPNLIAVLNGINQPLNDSNGFVQYTKDGQIFYYLHVPALNTTYVYNLNTQIWQERQSTIPVIDSDGQQRHSTFRARGYVNFGSMNLFFDSYSGAIFIEDYKNQTENGTYIRRQRISQTYSQDYQNISVGLLELDCTTGCGTLTGQGSNPIAMLEYSTDGGYNYKPLRHISLGLLALHEFRARLNRLGTGRNWVFRLTITDPVDLMIQNCIAHGTVGAS